MKSYEKAAAQVVLFNNSDVITTSGKYYCLEGFDIPGSGCQDRVHDGQVM